MAIRGLKSARKLENPKINSASDFIVPISEFDLYVASAQSALPIRLIETDNGDVVHSVSTLRPDAMRVGTISIPALTDSDYVTRETMHYDPSDSRLVETRSFHDIEGGEYYSTHFLYDRLGRRAVSATEIESEEYQVNLIVRDDWDRTTKVRSGVMNSVPTDYGTLAGTDSALKTMQICTYDGGGTGDSHKTRVRVFHSDSEVTDQIRHFTYRGASMRDRKTIQRQLYRWSTRRTRLTDYSK